MAEKMLEVKEVKKSRDISSDTTMMLWAASAGRCEFRGCNKKLFSHHVTGEKVNLAQKAHIYAFSQGGKRFSRMFQREKINDIDNLMLACYECHKLIDSSNTDYSAEMLLEMKKEHEERISLQTDIRPDLKSEIVIYTSEIADENIYINEMVAKLAIVPEHYPARDTAIRLSLNLNKADNQKNYFETHEENLEENFMQVQKELQDKHISLFAIAPQPLLFKLGTLFNRNFKVDVRQPQGSIDNFTWTSTEQTVDVKTMVFYKEKSHEVALSICFTAEIPETHILMNVGKMPIYKIFLEEKSPHCIKSKKDVDAFADAFRAQLNAIRKENAPDVKINLFSVAPASLSIEMGRQHMKGDPHIVLYDRDFETKEFKQALTL